MPPDPAEIVVHVPGGSIGRLHIAGGVNRLSLSVPHKTKSHWRASGLVRSTQDSLRRRLSAGGGGRGLGAARTRRRRQGNKSQRHDAQSRCKHSSTNSNHWLPSPLPDCASLPDLLLSIATLGDVVEEIPVIRKWRFCPAGSD